MSPHKTQTKRRLLLLFSLILGLALVILLERTIALSAWTLEMDGRWISEKRIIPYSLNGSWHFLAERQAVSRGRLNLGTWLGNQQVTYHQYLPYDTFEAQVGIPNGSWIWIFFDQFDGVRRGVRLSRNTQVSSGLFEVKPSGEFQLTQIKEEFATEKATLRVQRKSSDFAEVYVNDKLWFDQTPISPYVWISLRGSPFDSFVDQIKVQSSEGETILNFKAPFQMNLFISLLFFIGAFAFMAASRSFPSQLMCFSIYLFGLITISAWLWVDQHKVAPSYFNPSPTKDPKTEFFQTLSNYKRLASKKYPNFLGVIVQKIQKNGSVEMINPSMLSKEPPPKSPLIYFLGSSQTWGAGASSPEKTWPSVLIQKINSEKNASWEALNLSISGKRLFEMIEPYKAALAWQKPQLLILNIGYNDNIPGELRNFTQSLREILEINRARKIKSVIILEAVNSIINLEMIMHPEIKMICEEQKIPCFHSHQFFQELKTENLGIEWWDPVHFTDFGHQLLGERMLLFLEKERLLNP